MAKKTLQASAEATAALEERRALGDAPLPRLRDLGVAQQILDEWFAEMEGEETPELKQLWEKLSGDRRQKVLNWGHYLRNRDEQALLMQADEDFYRREANRLKERREAFEKQTERSYGALLFQMQEQSIDAAEDELVTVRRQRNPASLVGEVETETLMAWFQGEDPLHVGFVRYKPEQFELNRAAVKDAAKNMMIEQLPAGLSIVAAERVVVK